MDYDEKTQSGLASMDPEKMVDISMADIDIDNLSDDTKTDVYVQLRELYNVHRLDFNFPSDLLGRAREALDNEAKSHNAEAVRALLEEFRYQRDLELNDSPYPEVRALVPPVDDVDIPVNTFRAWFLGIIFAILGTGINQFFSMRYPGIWIYTYVAQFVAYPCGVFLAKFLPTYRFPLGPLSFTLNPGPFSQKEHMLISIMSNVAWGGFNGTAYVTNIIQVLKLPMMYDDQTLGNNVGWQLTTTLATQFIGYGTAGLARRFLVYPAAMIWPKCLSQIAVVSALHHDNGREDTAGGWKISRFRFFLWCTGGMFVYYWFPGYIFSALSFFNWITWIAPNNLNLAVVTGSICGMGLNPLPTFDWNMLSYVSDPIVTPFFSNVNQAMGMLLVSFFVVLPVYYTNTWQTGYLPLNSPNVFDNTGQPYSVPGILNPDHSLNVTAYEAYSPPYLSAGYASLYMFFFAAYTASIVHVALYNHKELADGFRSVRNWRSSVRDEFNDVHNRLMKKYKEAPEWWYLLLLAVAFVIACVSSEVYHTGMPIWGIVLAIIFAFTLQVPLGIITAVTNSEITLNVVAELIGGYTLAGNPIGNMLFKTYGYIATAQSIQFAADLKLGHYMKIPPRLTFWAQLAATIVCVFVSVGVNDWQIGNISGICTVDQAQGWSCPGTYEFFTASVVWGAVGPKRMFSGGGLYNATLWGFFLGAVLPVPFYYAARKWPNSFFRHVHIPVLLSGCLWLAPYNLSYYWGPVVVGYIFNVYIKSRHLGWWQKYAYILTTGFAVGLALSAIVIFFAVDWKIVNLSWWGNNVSFAGLDGTSLCPRLPIPKSGHF